MLIVGLTGGVGSGKSAAARFFSELNVTIIDADHIAKDLLDEPAITAAIIEHFGATICDQKGQLSRHKLRQTIFTHTEQRLWLEELLHPKIRERILAQIARSQSPYTIVVIPLLVETQKEDYINRILVIDVPEQVQISRVANRDGISPDEARMILAAQTQRKTRLAMANDVIENTDTLPILKNKVRSLHAYYLQIAENIKK
jgi:dephospho-CoA kinase